MHPTLAVTEKESRFVWVGVTFFGYQGPNSFSCSPLLQYCCCCPSMVWHDVYCLDWRVEWQMHHLSYDIGPACNNQSGNASLEMCGCLLGLQLLASTVSARAAGFQKLRTYNFQNRCLHSLHCTNRSAKVHYPNSCFNSCFGERLCTAPLYPKQLLKQMFPRDLILLAGRAMLKVYAPRHMTTHPREQSHDNPIKEQGLKRRAAKTFAGERQHLASFLVMPVVW